jgi:phosphoenolpyruvate-protein kinase (PTS system EI component)
MANKRKRRRERKPADMSYVMRHNGSVTLALLTVMVVMGLAGGAVYSYNRAQREIERSRAEVKTVRAERDKIKGEHERFVEETERLAREAQERIAEERKRTEQINRERSRLYETRLAAVNATYRKLRDQRAASASGGGMPAVPDATRPADDAARDQRLLDVLQHAEKQTAQLIELQEWVRQQSRGSKP